MDTSTEQDDKVSESAKKRQQPCGGSRKGSPNKSTAIAREAIARFVDGNSDRLQEWLDQIAEQEGPKEAFRCFMDVVEYHVPKLARTEHTGEGGGPVVIQATTLDERI